MNIGVHPKPSTHALLFGAIERGGIYFMYYNTQFFPWKTEPQLGALA